jgi:hypothetical protein
MLTGNQSQTSNVWRGTVIALCVLGVVLLVLFQRSLQPGQVLFSNDSPLGVLTAQAGRPLGAFTGYWQDLNWLGLQQPSAVPGPTQALFIVAGPLVWGSGGPVVFAKFYAPLALLLTGLAGFFLARTLGLGWVAGLLVGLAALLNSDSFSHACWGLPSVSLGLAATLVAVGMLQVARGSARVRVWVYLVLAGFAVGLAVMESYDVGAILSLYVAAFIMFQALAGDGTPGQRIVRGAGGVAIVAAAAVFISAQALSTLVGTQVKGVAGMAQDEATRAGRWREATQWSLPKRETLQLVVPGLFGYRMDTPEGGWYWGGVGRDPVWDEYLASSNPDPATAPAGGLMRHSGAGFYAGILVVTVAIWALVFSWRGNGNPFSLRERRHIWFWAGAALISLVLAYGRHAPFYQIIYQLPFFSTIRNPIKFLHPLQISLLILFGYGLVGLWRGYLEPARARHPALGEQFRVWWRAAATADRRWVLGCAAVVVLAGLAWLVYSSSAASLAAHLGRVGFTDPEMARSIAHFSAKQAGIGLLFLAAAVALLVSIMAGVWSGRRQRWAGVVLGVILVGDLARADLPWIVYYDYREKYESNALIEFLRKDPANHRVTGRLMPRGGGALVNEQGQVLVSVYNEWLEHLFQYYRVPSLDIVQMPRVPLLDEAFMNTFHPANNEDFAKIGRLWELTNTRFIVGMTGFIDMLNQTFDAGQKRFRVHTAFTLLPKSGVEQVTRLSQLTVLPSTNGPFALFEFGGALPRASLVARWEVVTNDVDCLGRLGHPEFNAHDTVLVSEDIPASSTSGPNSGTVVIEAYEPKRVLLKANVTAPSVLLLNDRYHPDWKVFVNGERRDLLRCNHIMRGVRLESGEQVVEFKFQPSATALYVSLAAIAVGFVLLAGLIVGARATTDGALPAPSREPKRPQRP